MKKFLSLIGVISLVSLTSASVVSCVIRTPEKPVFNSLSSVSQNSWNLLTKSFAKGELDPTVNGTPQAASDALIKTVANDFKNPDTVKEYFKTYDVQYRVDNAEKVNDKEGKLIYTNITLSLLGKETESSTDHVVRARNLNAKVTEKQRLAINPDAATTVTFTSEESNIVYREILKFANTYKSLDPSIPVEAIKSNAMYNLNIATRNTLITNLSKTYLPGFNDEFYYETLGKQLAYLKEKFSDFDQTIITTVNSMGKDNIYLEQIKQKFSSLTLGNFTITLTAA